MSEWYVRVVKLGEVRDLPNSDKLSITDVDGGYPCIVPRNQFKRGDNGIYIPLDSLVPIDKPEFSFLDKPRIKAKRLRGTFSMGLLIPIPKNLVGKVKEGDIVDKQLGITKWEPDVDIAERKEKPKLFNVVTENEKDPKILPEYDIEGVRKYKNVLTEGEEVYISEKLDGANGRWVFSSAYNKFYAASHFKYKKRPQAATLLRLYASKLLLALYNILYFIIGHRLKTYKLKKLANQIGKGIAEKNLWKIAKQYNLEEKLKNYPDIALYGEVYGDVQKLKYGCKPGELKFAVFDVYDVKKNQYYDYEDFKRFTKEIDVPTVPELYVGPWNYEEAYKMSNGKTTIPGANHIREGIVIKPLKERTAPWLGRVIVKLVGEDYLLMKEK